MFGSIGGPELIVIFLVALLIFGPRKLPELGRMLGKGLGEFRRASSELRQSLESEVALGESSAGRETPAGPTSVTPAPPSTATRTAAEPAVGDPGAPGARDAEGPIERR